MTERVREKTGDTERDWVENRHSWTMRRALESSLSSEKRRSVTESTTDFVTESLKEHVRPVGEMADGLCDIRET